MKIIDLLNKIANGEEVPKKIKINNKTYEFDKTDNEYRRYDRGGSFTPLYEFMKNGGIEYFSELIQMEAEIIEEEKEIEPLVYDEDCTNEWCIKELYEKVYELTKAVNEIRKEK